MTELLNAGEMIKIRRRLHMFPEVSFEEKKTAEYIAGYLRGLDLNVQTGVGGLGVLASIKGRSPGKTVALRADFDALPIQDEKDADYKSQNKGAMHACGHDAHTAALCGVARVLAANKDAFKGEVRLIFQHAEELAPGGAISMIKDGCLDGVDAIFGCHVNSLRPVGQHGYCYGPTMSNSDAFHITIKGKGGHGASPQDSVDPIVVSANVILQFQQIVSRRVNPKEAAVLSVCSIKAGNVYNIIPDSLSMIGTVRTYKSDVQALIIKEMEQILKGACEAASASYTLDYSKGYPALINSKEETNLVRQALAKLGRDTIEESPHMGAEDFAYYLQKVPGSFFFTGAGNAKKGTTYPHHHPKFDIDEDSILHSAEALLQVALDYLK